MNDLCSLFHVKHSARMLCSPLSNGYVKPKTEIVEHIVVGVYFLAYWSSQHQIYAETNNVAHFSHNKLSRH